MCNLKPNCQGDGVWRQGLSGIISSCGLAPQAPDPCLFHLLPSFCQLAQTQGEDGSPRIRNLSLERHQVWHLDLGLEPCWAMRNKCLLPTVTRCSTGPHWLPQQLALSFSFPQRVQAYISPETATSATRWRGPAGEAKGSSIIPPASRWETTMSKPCTPRKFHLLRESQKVAPTKRQPSVVSSWKQTSWPDSIRSIAQQPSLLPTEHHLRR